MIKEIKNKSYWSRGSVLILIAIVVIGVMVIFAMVAAAVSIGNGTGPGSGMSDGGTGGLCSDVPTTYQTIFSSAASGDIPPSMLAAIFSIEHGQVESYASGYKPVGAKNDAWPEEKGDPTKITQWQTSSAGAQGPMQFMPDTWKSYGGGGNVQNISDAMAGTANMMQKNFDSQHGTPEEKLRKAVARYNSLAGPWNNSWYVDKVWAKYDKYNCGGGGAGNGDIVAIAAREVGHTESGCHDCGVEKYTDGKNLREEWCADFVSWVYNQAGYKFTRNASSSGLYNWFRKYQTGFDRGAGTPQPGDVIYFHSHIGIVEKVANGKVFTIEGNANHDSNGYGRVARNHYPLDSGEITGYGRWKN